MELYRIAIRAVFIYIVLLALIRLSGKRTVAEGTSFAFVLALILGDMIDDGLWAEVPAAQFVVGAGTLATAHLVVSWAAWRIEWVERIVSGEPTAVMEGGRARRAGLRAERMNEKALAFEVRQAGVADGRWAEIQCAHVEASGAFSLLKAPWARGAQRRDAEAVRKARS